MNDVPQHKISRFCPIHCNPLAVSAIHTLTLQMYFASIVHSVFAGVRSDKIVQLKILEIK